MRPLLPFLLMCVFPAAGQTPARPVVLLLNGYQAACSLFGSNSSDTFGNLQAYLEEAGYSVRWVDNCRLHGVFEFPPIEDLAEGLAQIIDSLKNPDGSPAGPLYAVAHSMGGLILRSYLSGKQTGPGVFRPPADPRIAKAVFIASPHFGTRTGLSLFVSWHPQVQEMTLGSRFLWDLNTWHQGRDDLRGIEAISIIGNGGSYAGQTGAGDGLVSLASASLASALPEDRIRIFPFCHSSSTLHQLTGACPSSAPGAAQVDSKEHPSWKVISSFLSGANEWKTLGTAVGGDAWFSASTAVMASVRKANDEEDTAVTAVWSQSPAAAMSGGPVYYSEALAPGAQDLRVLRGSQESVWSVTLARGGFRTLTWKPGPVLYLVAPAAAALPSLSLAPGMIVAIYGAALAGSAVTLEGTALQLFYVGDTQINALLPDAATTGLKRLTVRNAQGEVNWNILLEPAVPAIFTADGSGTGPAAGPGTTAFASGEYVTLYATGLGPTIRRGGLDWASLPPTVRLGGRTAQVHYAGRAPGFPGLDQINVQVPEGLAPGPAPLLVESNGRSSNTVTVTIRGGA